MSATLHPWRDLPSWDINYPCRVSQMAFSQKARGGFEWIPLLKPNHNGQPKTHTTVGISFPSVALFNL